METKKDLNNTQRKMLDEIYTEQFEKKARLIRQEREQGYNKLQARLLVDEAKTKDVKAVLEAGAKFYDLERRLRDKLAAKGVYITNAVNDKPSLSVVRYSRKGDFSELVKYQSETNKIDVALGEKKKLMRAKIYGVSASYEEVEKDIEKLLKDV